MLYYVHLSNKIIQATNHGEQNSTKREAFTLQLILMYPKVIIITTFKGQMQVNNSQFCFILKFNDFFYRKEPLIWVI